MWRLSFAGARLPNRMACRITMLLAAVTMMVGPASAEQAAKRQAGRQAADDLKPDRVTASAAAWGKTAAGLRCAISLERLEFRVGDPIAERAAIDAVRQRTKQ